MKNDATEHQSASASPAKTNGHWQSPGRAQLQEQVVDTAKKAYSDFVEIAGETMTSANKQAAKYIRQYPVQIAAGALTVGFLLGVSLFRRKA